MVLYAYPVTLWIAAVTVVALVGIQTCGAIPMPDYVLQPAKSYRDTGVDTAKLARDNGESLRGTAVNHINYFLKL